MSGDLVPRLSIARVRWAQPREALIGGRASTYALNAQGSRVWVDDGSGGLDVWCSADTPGAEAFSEHKLCDVRVTTDVSSWTPTSFPQYHWDTIFQTPPDAVALEVSPGDVG